MRDIETVARRLEEAGEIRTTLAAMRERLAEIGYRIGSDRCHSIHRCMTGTLAGLSYPGTVGEVEHIATGLNFAHVDAPRDANLRALQDYRGSHFAVVRGRIFCL